MTQPTTADQLDRIAMSLQQGIAQGIRRGLYRPTGRGNALTREVELEPAPLDDLTDAQLEVAQELRRQRLEDAPPEVIHRRVDHLEVLNRRLQRTRP